MNIVVTMKAVPASTEVSMDPVTNTIVREGGDAVWNPYDTAALELALQLRDLLGGKVTVLSMGIPATEALLRDALARGADDAILLSDRAFAGSDTLATTYALHRALETRGEAVDLVLCGKMAVDGDTAQIGPELSWALGVPCVTGVDKIADATTEHLVVRQVFDGSLRHLRLPYPCLITVDKDAATVRLASAPGVLAAPTKPLVIWDAEAVGADLGRCGLDGSPTQVVRCRVPELSGEAQEILGDAAGQAAAIIDIVREVRP